jgi:3-deoxy-D-manno-octulosonate 8-phosphate phosphatase (KDO 8-P phosphatase)
LKEFDYQDIQQRAARIRLLVLDVDGVLTDGSIVYTDTGEQIKCFHVRDGHGLRMLQQAGLEVALITGRQSAALTHRAENLRLRQVFQGVRDKIAVLRSLQTSLGISSLETAVMGDDLVDLAMMQQAGLAVTVADAPSEVKERAHLVTSAPGGRGAVRELCELVLKAQGVWEELLRHYLGD